MHAPPLARAELVVTELFEVGPVRFELVERGRRRFYTMRLERDRQLAIDGVGQAGGWVLVIARGRIGGKPIVRREPFSSPTLAIERWGELAMRRRRHGYAAQGGA